jgi:UDP-N-acetylglucosamine 1-carboxyvinyltransferase
VSLPGGCAIGARPIDQHLAGLEALGATVEIEGDYVLAKARRLTGANFRFAMPTVTGTENLLMAASLARGTTVLKNCAREPEIVDLARLLISMGARIEGAGSATITIEGVDSLGGGEHRVIADRIQVGTYLIAGAITGGAVTVDGCQPADLAPLLEKLSENGVQIQCGPDSIGVSRSGPLKASDMTTTPHPGFPTDLQAQYMALMTQAEGCAALRETVFEKRFQHVPELNRMGADIRIDGNSAQVHGPCRLSGATVMATDLRASASLVLAALVARGVTLVEGVHHLDRGYENMESNLQALGACIDRIPS